MKYYSDIQALLCGIILGMVIADSLDSDKVLILALRITCALSLTLTLIRLIDTRRKLKILRDLKKDIEKIGTDEK